MRKGSICATNWTSSEWLNMPKICEKSIKVWQGRRLRRVHDLVVAFSLFGSLVVSSIVVYFAFVLLFLHVLLFLVRFAWLSIALLFCLFCLLILLFRFVDHLNLLIWGCGLLNWLLLSGLRLLSVYMLLLGRLWLVLWEGLGLMIDLTVSFLGVVDGEGL